MHLDGLYVIDDDLVVTRARDPHPQRARWRGFCFSGTRASMRSSVPLSMWSVAPVFGWQDRRAVYDSAWRARSALSPCLLHKVHITRPKPLRLRLSLALPPAHAHPHPPWLIIVHLYYYHGPPRPATTRTRLQRAVQPRMPHRPDTPCCHVPYWRLCNMRVRPTTA